MLSTSNQGGPWKLPKGTTDFPTSPDVPVRVLKRGNQRSEALFYKLPNLCKSLKVNQAPKPPELFSEVFFGVFCCFLVQKTKVLNMARQMFEHIFPNFWCFDLLFPYACVRLMGGSVDVVGSVDTISIGLKHGFHVFQDWEA